MLIIPFFLLSGNGIWEWYLLSTHFTFPLGNRFWNMQSCLAFLTECHCFTDSNLLEIHDAHHMASCYMRQHKHIASCHIYTIMHSMRKTTVYLDTIDDEKIEEIRRKNGLRDAASAVRLAIRSYQFPSEVWQEKRSISPLTFAINVCEHREAELCILR